MTEDDRDAFNAKEYARFRGKGTTRNECEICGFVPYTKNKYREKQDHLAKLHFKVSLQNNFVPENAGKGCAMLSRFCMMDHKVSSYNIPGSEQGCGSVFI
jgi:hypothetical protein